MLTDYSRIVVAYDHSELSKKDLKIAMNLAKQDRQIELIVLMVLQPARPMVYSYGYAFDSYQESQREEANAVRTEVEQEIKSLPNEPMKYVLRREEAITEIFERILQKGIADGSLQVDPKDVKLMAHNIIILGEMWVFRRWALRKHYTLEEYIEAQTNLLLQKLTHHHS